MRPWKSHRFQKPPLHAFLVWTSLAWRPVRPKPSEAASPLSLKNAMNFGLNRSPFVKANAYHEQPARWARIINMPETKSITTICIHGQTSTANSQTLSVIELWCQAGAIIACHTHSAGAIQTRHREFRSTGKRTKRASKYPHSRVPNFNFANIYLAESHVKHHSLTRGFLETVNWELKSVDIS